MFLRYAYLAIFTISQVVLFAQTGSIRGFVYNKSNGEPIMFTNVVIEGTTLGSTTDINGYFSITQVKPGNHKLVTTYLGFDTVITKVLVNTKGIVTKNIFLTPKAKTLNTFEVNADKINAQNNVQISSYEISSEKIRQLPAMGAEADIIQYLQVLPGVVYTGEQGGQMYIRGGSPIQNKVLLDGMVIYNPFHSIGIFSVFETDIIRHADIITGGFNADNGGRLSALIDITTKDGNKKEFSGKISSNPFLGKVILEGPIQKLKSNGASSSYIFTAKQSYIKHTGDLLYPYLDSRGLPYEFRDIYGKISLNSKNGTKFNLFGFNFNDKVVYENESLDWKSYGLGNKFILVPNNSTSLIEGNISYSDYTSQLYSGQDTTRFSQINNFNIGLNFNYFLPKTDIKYGFAIMALTTNYSFVNSFDIFYSLIDNATDFNGFVKFKHRANKWVLEPGLRLQYYAGLREMSLEPRLGLKYNMNDFLRFKFAGGKYTQNLISAVSEHDIVNLFSGFLFSPEEQLTGLDGEITNDKLQKAWHAVFGVEIDLAKNLSLQLEPYFKYFAQTINVNRYKMFAQDPNYLIEVGDSYGTDISLKYDNNQVYVWGTYSISKTLRNDGVEKYPTHFDRIHNVNFLFSYSFGKDLDWETSLRWNLGSGFPFTLTKGFYEELNIGQDVDFLNNNGDIGVIYGERNQGRLPYYHRLDFSVRKHFYFGENADLEVIASVTNAYNRPNVFYFDRLSYTRIDQLPIMPAIGLSLSF